MTKAFLYFFLSVSLWLFAFMCSAQGQDSIRAKKRSFVGNILYGIKQSFGKDTLGRRENVTVLNTEALLPYEGKTIRSIKTRQLDFNMSFSDTTNDILYFGTKVLNSIHATTRDKTIRRNLYLKEGETMNAYLIADNERYLRTVGYIQDSRIIVNKRTSTDDSIDLIVITKDLFEYVPSTGGISPSRQRVGLGNNNLFGSGQSASFSFLHDTRRSASVGMQVNYGYNSFMSSFINVSLSASRIAKNIYDHREDEENFLLSLDRPLVSQYKRLAGGFSVGKGKSLNMYPNYYGGDYYSYDYGLVDAWVGYNIGARKYLQDKKLHIKKFLALRYFNTTFFETPHQINENIFDQRFNSRQGIIAGLTLFRQYYYKTKYIYGFGITEDVPSGFNVSINAGWYKQLNLSRPYLGVDAYRYFVSPKRDIGCLFARTGLFLNDGNFEDIGILYGASFFTRIIPVGNMKWRQYFRASYATILNRVALDPLRMNNALGLQNFSSDLASGDRRLALRSESAFFLQQKYFGFKLAPFLTGDFIYLGDNNSPIDASGIFYGLGGGFRTRNENLIFGTIEFRGIVYPRKVQGDNNVKFSAAFNLKFRYNGSYVSKPDIVELNSDNTGDIY
ncbi:hypothetical protein F0919_13940 [Taibaiella lutea]|uniref:Haemolysin activator HlyB C-terminal domain-containing protein n=1 Tax=Taibaiella lutea TaxID=2608001 RepID=A0A5M6CFA2_9BACT|nr:hypothetical protein [Taibaiella lutea]KAA5533633.1 hypothetical protein F0919_13940 [Taibaiella lutea]